MNDEKQSKLFALFEQHAQDLISAWLIKLQQVNHEALDELDLAGALSAEDLFNAAAQAHGLDHPKIRAARAQLAERLAAQAVTAALASIERPPPRAQTARKPRGEAA